MNQKRLISLLLLGALLAFMKFMEAFPKTATTLILVVVAYGALRNFFRKAKEAHWFTKWTMVRRIRKMRGAFLPSANATACFAGAFALGMVGVSLVYLSWVRTGNAFLGGSATFLGLATIVDWYGRLKYLLASRLARRLCLAIFAFLGATTVFISNVLANHFTREISHANPAFMPEFVRLASAAIYPFSLILVIALALTLVMLIQALSMLVIVLLTTVLSRLAFCTTPSLTKKVSDLKYRLVNGQKPPTNPRWWEKGFAGIQTILRPFGTMIVVVTFAFVGQSSLDTAAKVPMEYFKKVLVATEYHTPHQCENVDAKAAVSYQDDGYVSVATVKDNNFVFESKKCHKPT